MRLIHTSDWHLGQEFHRHDRFAEHDAFLDWLLEQARRTNADAILVTGDIYDTSNPPVQAQQRLYRFLRRVLAENDHLQIVLIGGNHDSAGRLELPAALLGDERVRLIGSLPRTDGRADLPRIVLPLRDRNGKTSLQGIAMPFLRNSDLPAGEGAAGVSALYAEAMALARAHGLPVIATGHLTLRGGDVSKWSERSFSIGGQDAVASDIFDSGIRYLALGHLHKPQGVDGPTTIRYAGSPFPLSVTERDYEHSIVIVDIDDGGTVTIDLARIPRHAAFLRVPDEGAAAADAIERQLQELDTGDVPPERAPFLEVNVQLFGPDPELHRRITRLLEAKNVRLTRINRYSAGDPNAFRHVDAVAEDLMARPVDVFKMLHKRDYSCDPEPELLALFSELLEVARAGADEGSPR